MKDILLYFPLLFLIDIPFVYSITGQYRLSSPAKQETLSGSDGVAVKI